MKVIALIALLFAVSEAAQRAIPYDEWVSNGGYPLPDALRTEADNFKYPVEGLNDTRIVGGSTAASGQFPFQISLRRTSHSCGGSIYNARTIITAAHCTAGTSASALSIRYNSLAHASGGTLVTITRIAQHSGYNSATIDNDIALVITSSALTLGQTNAQAVTVAASGTDPASGTSVTVSGWGTTSSGGSTLPANLLYVAVNIVARATCNSNYGSGSITNNMICAALSGKDSCQGDSGGPLINTSSKQQVGIVSWGRGCAQAGYPGVYTRITNYNSWISTNAQN